jgi:acyl-CoA thioester hydrolase
MDPIASEAEFRQRFPAHFEHEVEFREIDMLRHVNNIRYAEWAETMRSIYFDDILGLSFSAAQSVILARHDMQYVAPVAYRERVIVGGAITRFGSKSFDFTTAVWSIAGARTVFHSTAVLVAYDYEQAVSIAIPPLWRERAAGGPANNDG